MATKAKEFEKVVRKKMERMECLRHVVPGGDGLVRIPPRCQPNQSCTVHAHEIPTDIWAWRRNGGQCVLVEAKRLSGRTRSLSVIPRDSEGSGLQEHQLRRLIEVQLDGGVGLLVVCFESAGVYCINGLGLKMWFEGTDEKGNMKSISLEHFGEHGNSLGVEGHWNFLSQDFEPIGGGLELQDGPVFLAEDLHRYERRSTKGKGKSRVLPPPPKPPAPPVVPDTGRRRTPPPPPPIRRG